VSGPRLIATTRTLPSAMATGPSGNCSPVASSRTSVMATRSSPPAAGGVAGPAREAGGVAGPAQEAGGVVNYDARRLARRLRPKNTTALANRKAIALFSLSVRPTGVPLVGCAVTGCGRTLVL